MVLLAFLFGTLLVAAVALALSPRPTATIERRLGEVTGVGATRAKKLAGSAA